MSEEKSVYSASGASSDGTKTALSARELPELPPFPCSYMTASNLRDWGLSCYRVGMDRAAEICEHGVLDERWYVTFPRTPKSCAAAIRAAAESAKDLR